MVLTVSFALSLVTGLSCHHRLLVTTCKLERQRRGVRTTRLRRPQQRALVSRAFCVHRIPHPTSVTIAKRPSEGARRCGYIADLA
jgi:hypothetical protein